MRSIKRVTKKMKSKKRSKRRSKTYKMYKMNAPRFTYDDVQNAEEWYSLVKTLPTPDYVYISFGSEIPERKEYRKEYNVYQILPDFARQLTGRLLCIMVDTSPDETELKKVKMAVLKSALDGNDLIINFIQIHENCSSLIQLPLDEKSDQKEHREQWVRWNNCVSDLIEHIAVYLEETGCGKCIIANFVKFKVDTYHVSDYFQRILFSRLKKYQLYEWFGFTHPDILIKYDSRIDPFLLKQMALASISGQSRRKNKIILRYTGSGDPLYFISNPWE